MYVDYFRTHVNEIAVRANPAAPFTCDAALDLSPGGIARFHLPLSTRSSYFF